MIPAFESYRLVEAVPEVPLENSLQIEKKENYVLPAAEQLDYIGPDCPTGIKNPFPGDFFSGRVTADSEWGVEGVCERSGEGKGSEDAVDRVVPPTTEVNGGPTRSGRVEGDIAKEDN